MEVPESKAISDCANTRHEGALLRCAALEYRIARVEGEEESTRDELVV